MSKILVTGGGGFIGGRIVKKLLDDGHEVTVTAMGNETIDPRAKVTYCGLNGIDWDVLKGIDIVFHQAANNDTLCQNEAEMMRVNFGDSHSLLCGAEHYGVKKFIYASSTAVYGDSPAPYVEGVTEEKPLNAYGRSKLTFDRFVEGNKIKAVGFRYCNVYGPGEEHKGHRMSMIGQMIRKAKKGETIKLFKWGEQRRDWVYVDDVVKANLLAMQSDVSGIFNIGSGHSYTFNEIVRAIQLELYLNPDNTKPEYIDCPFAESYQDYTECCVDKAKAAFGYIPQYDVYKGIKAYIMYERTKA